MDETNKQLLFFQKIRISHPENFRQICIRMKINHDLPKINLNSLNETQLFFHIHDFFDKIFSDQNIINFINNTYDFTNLDESKILNIIKQINDIAKETAYIPQQLMNNKSFKLPQETQNEITRQTNIASELTKYFQNILQNASRKGGSKTRKNKKSKKVKSRKMRK